MKRLIAATGAAPAEPANDGTSRRQFLAGGAGVAAGAAIAAAGSKVGSVVTLGGGAGAQPAAAVTKPSGPPPSEPVTAYVRDARRGEVTVLSGKTETTYRDPALVKRLLDAAK
jgi:TAT (twin-arginine translocation) pathway signal sequence